PPRVLPGGGRIPGHESLARQRPRYPGNDDRLLRRAEEGPRAGRGSAPGSARHVETPRPRAPLLLGELHPIRRMGQPGRASLTVLGHLASERDRRVPPERQGSGLYPYFGLKCFRVFVLSI